MKTFLKMCDYLKRQDEFEYESLDYLLSLHIRSKQLVYAECINGVTDMMRSDNNVDIISDTGIFIITNKLNALNYEDLSFEDTDSETISSYKEQIINLKHLL